MARCCSLAAASLAAAPLAAAFRAAASLAAAPLAAAVCALAVAGAAQGVIIDSGDGSGNTSAPSPDPGFDHVGQRGGGSAVVIQDGWVLTADHLGVGNVWLDGVPHVPVVGSEVQLGSGTADLLIFAVTPDPGLPTLAISSTPPPSGASLLLIGEGRNRGGGVSGDCNGPPPPSGGYAWGVGRTVRWGTNFAELPTQTVLDTQAFGSLFQPGGSAHEAQAAHGDSGGAAFVWTGSAWELAGVIFANSLCSNQPSETSLYGNATYYADLSVYRDEILDVIALPEPRAGLAPGAALLAALGRRRRSRSRPA